MIIMMILFFFVSSLVFSAKVFNNHCSKELEEIVYFPNYYYKDYLIDISKELGNLASYYDSPEGKSYVSRISIKYRIGILVFDAFGNFDAYEAGPIFRITIADGYNKYTSSYAKALMNLGSYRNDYKEYVYSFLSFSKNGVVYQVTLEKLK